MIQDIFQALNLKEEETKTYLTLLESGTSAAGELAKKMGIPRPTLYGYLEKLCEAGLAAHGMKRNVKMFVAEPPDKIKRLYSRKIDDLRKRERQLDELIPDLEKRYGMRMMRPKIQFYEGVDEIMTMLEDHLSFEGLTMYAFWAIRSVLETVGEDFFNYMNKERIKKDSYLRGIWPHNQQVSVKRYPFMGVGDDYKRELRVAPPGVECSMGYWIYSNRSLFMSSSAESFGFIIESDEMAQTMITQHQVIWDLSEVLKVERSDMKPFLDELAEEL